MQGSAAVAAEVLSLLALLVQKYNPDAADLTLRVAEVPEGRDLLADIGEQVQRGASLPEDAGTGDVCSRMLTYPDVS